MITVEELRKYGAPNNNATVEELREVCLAAAELIESLFAELKEAQDELDLHNDRTYN